VDVSNGRLKVEWGGIKVVSQVVVLEDMRIEETAIVSARPRLGGEKTGNDEMQDEGVV
jgi:hypothetical protein